MVSKIDWLIDCKRYYMSWNLSIVAVWIYVLCTFVIVDPNNSSIIPWEIIYQYSFDLKNSLLTCSNDHNNHQIVEWSVEQNYQKPW
jgi:hypothetical protein